MVQLHGLLTEIDPVRWRDDAAEALKARFGELQRRLAQRARLAELAGALQTNLRALEQPSSETRAGWLAFKQRLMPAYEAVAVALRAEKIHVPSLRPTNWARTLFHVAAALVAVATIEWAHSPTLILIIAVTWAVSCWALELARRLDPRVNRVLMRFFKPVAHIHEATRVNSSTWYATGLLVLALTQSALLCATAVAILGVADPMAALVGRKFGRIKLIHGRSLEGTLTFFVSGSLIAFAVLRLFHTQLDAGQSLAVAIAAAACGALAELLSLRVDDNLSVPVSAALGAALALSFC
ncbi:MAG: phosphatidate cytidylyltransferase [Myxococcaceae bacterium]|nr:phosphatidate cytidylyltransferase [Myxococcaceae bacterium]